MFQKNITFADITDLVPLPVQLPKDFQFPPPRHQSLVKPLLEKVKQDQLREYLVKLSSNSPHRASRRAGSEISIDWTVNTIKAIIAKLPAERQKLFKIELITITGYVAKSIIVTFQGKVEESVIIGAHIDDVGHPSAGADDNGSGSVSVLESFRVIAESSYLPNRAILFMFYTAEESGLIGSRQIAQDFKRQNKKVYAVLNHDMVGYHRPNTPLQAYMVIPSTNSALNTFTKALIAEYSGIPVTNYNNGYGSDHASWNSAGYPASCWKEFYWSPQYHQSTDKVEHISFPLVAEFAKIAVAFGVELSHQ